MKAIYLYDETQEKLLRLCKLMKIKPCDLIAGIIPQLEDYYNKEHASSTFWDD